MAKIKMKEKTEKKTRRKNG
ncbi:hypothetical protein CCACVL1_07679 [Corchorus capsularis]|uniref:Uncharacterized protein n=1 Tax=Corchorus capsularis TaxID=210143 RepID=A0A1R3J4F8_COCAP|nr:hypothetical protein CCACVL1_07679 [Corchorus capsularis]